MLRNNILVDSTIIENNRPRFFSPGPPTPLVSFKERKKSIQNRMQSLTEKREEEASFKIPVTSNTSPSAALSANTSPSVALSGNNNTFLITFELTLCIIGIILYGIVWSYQSNKWELFFAGLFGFVVFVYLLFKLPGKIKDFFFALLIRLFSLSMMVLWPFAGYLLFKFYIENPYILYAFVLAIFALSVKVHYPFLFKKNIMELY